MRSDEYAEHDGLGLAGLVAGGQVTATELLAAARARADLVDPRINALFARLDDHADARVPQELTGPYAGVPLLLKHLHSTWQAR